MSRERTMNRVTEDNSHSNVISMRYYTALGVISTAEYFTQTLYVLLLRCSVRLVLLR